MAKAIELRCRQGLETTIYMTLADMIPAIRALPAADKLHLIRILAEELEAASDSVFTMAPDVEYPIYSPYDSFDAAKAVMDALANDPQPLPAAN